MEFFEIVKCNLPVDETIQRLEEELADQKFNLFWKHDITTKLFEHGIHFPQDYWILEMGHPDWMKKILNSDPIAGLFLPCKMIVYRDQTTYQTKVGLLKPSTFLPLIEDSLTFDSLLQLEKSLIQVLNQLEQHK